MLRGPNEACSADSLVRATRLGTGSIPSTCDPGPGTPDPVYTPVRKFRSGAVAAISAWNVQTHF